MTYRPLWMRILLDPKPADGSGGGGDGGGNNNPPAPQPDLTKVVEDLLKKHGNDQSAAIRAVLAERDTLRDELSATRGKLPRDGHVVIDPDTHKSLSAYQALGKADELQQALYERDELKEQVAQRARVDLHAAAAKLHGYTASVLTKLADGLEIVIKEGKNQLGKAVEIAHVKTADDKGAEVLTPLVEHAEKHWKDFLPALKASQDPAKPPVGAPPRGNQPPRPPINPQDGTQPRVRRNAF